MPETLSKPNLEQIILELKQVPDVVWGKYQFQRDLLNKKITQQQKRQMIASSIACGIATARKIRREYGKKSSSEIFDEMGVSIRHSDEEQIGNRLLFALYDPDRGVLLMDNPIKKFSEFSDQTGFNQEQIENYILSHELFHHIESHDSEIYTQKTKIDLWKFLFYTYRSNVRALSEIAAMSFSKEFNQLDFSPYLLELVLVWPYDQGQTVKLYNEVKSLLEDETK
ncbi:hypothetical protein [Enterococcus massiliensis]|uniref:hypothetical protein n=1 Tax=Enterococcus massiliensis TaxID=1640685 RepID=UPI00065E3931|nr:hypothetical protein [Enterococcus massiliensis]